MNNGDFSWLSGIVMVIEWNVMGYERIRMESNLWGYL
jgi:hypothetical protein